MLSDLKVTKSFLVSLPLRLLLLLLFFPTVDYFTKWVDAEELVHIIEANTTNFVKKNILYRFGIPSTIIIDNETQFDNNKFREMYEEYKIANYYASPAHPQTNGQTKAVNKVIKHTLKAKLEAKKGS